MLRRDQQLRTQIQQLLDAALFAISLWLAHLWRESWAPYFLRIDFFYQFVTLGPSTASSQSVTHVAARSTTADANPAASGCCALRYLVVACPSLERVMGALFS